MKKRTKIVLSIFLLLLIIVLYVLLRHDRAAAPARSNEAKQSTSTPPSAKSEKTAPSTTEPTSLWVVVNKSHPLNPLTYEPTDLVSVGSGQVLRKQAAEALQELQKNAQIAGYKISALSAYRSYKTQQTVYANEVATVGQAQADRESAKPGYSEHQTGFAVDVGGGGCGIEDCFGETKEGKWVAQHAHEYGFVVRYPAGKESITGYRYEPWHLRFVGTELAAQLHASGQTLEEFFQL